MLAPEGAGVGKGAGGAPAKEARQAFREAKRDDRKTKRTDAKIARDEARGGGKGVGGAKTSEVTEDEAASTPEASTPDEQLTLAKVAREASREFLALESRLRTHSHISGPHTTTPAVSISMVSAVFLRSESVVALVSDLHGYFATFAAQLRQHMHLTTGGWPIVAAVIDPRLEIGIHGRTPGAIEAEFHALLAILRKEVDGHVHTDAQTGRDSSPPMGTPAFEALVATMQGQANESPDGR